LCLQKLNKFFFFFFFFGGVGVEIKFTYHNQQKI
jgi:hypothetical protein